MRRKRLGVALGGGGIRGAAHIGVLEVLEENEIVADVVTGTSAGSIVGALYAAGVNLSVLRELSQNLNKGDIFAWNFNPHSFIQFLLSNLRDMASLLDAIPRALFSGKKIGQLVEKTTKKNCFSEIAMPFGVVAVDLITGKKVVFSNISSLPQLPETVFFQKAPLGAAVQASCAIPGVFEPVPYQGTLLADGGLLEMVPAPLARLLGSRKVIGVSLKQKGSVQEPQSLIQVVQRGINIMNLQGTRFDLDSADLVIEPLALDAELDDFGRVTELLERGRRAAEMALPDIKRLLY
jgi:NTE family protein